MNIREMLVQLLHSSPSHMETLSLMRIIEVINLQAIICMKAIPPYQRWCAWGFYRMVSQFGFRLCWAKLLPKPSCWSLYSISWFSSMLSGLVSDLLLLSSLSDFLEKFWFSLLIIIILFNYYKVFFTLSVRAGYYLVPQLLSAIKGFLLVLYGLCVDTLRCCGLLPFRPSFVTHSVMPSTGDVVSVDGDGGLDDVGTEADLVSLTSTRPIIIPGRDHPVLYSVTSNDFV